jgi:hypothetical protein
MGEGGGMGMGRGSQWIHVHFEKLSCYCRHKQNE